MHFGEGGEDALLVVGIEHCLGGAYAADREEFLDYQQATCLVVVLRYVCQRHGDAGPGCHIAVEIGLSRVRYMRQFRGSLPVKLHEQIQWIPAAIAGFQVGSGSKDPFTHVFKRLKIE